MLNSIDIPDEILILILKRLPTKSLLRFMSVSKSWNSIISSPFFINAHLNQETHPLIIFQCSTRPESFPLHFDNEPFDRYLDFKFPYKRDYALEVIGCCNGVVCLWDGYCRSTRSLFLWNPSIRKSLKLPAPKLPCAGYVLSGFGFDSLSNDYKVVRVVKPNQKKLVRPILSQVYSLKARSWKNTIDVSLEIVSSSSSSRGHHIVNGVVHWLLFCESENSRLQQPLVLCFNVHNESFKVMMLPQCMIRQDITGMLMSVFDNSLALLMRDHNSSVPCFHVWLMKEHGVKESWTKLFSISHQIRAWALFRRNGEILTLEYLPYKKVISCDPRSPAVRNLENIVGDQYGYVGHFLETLALLNESDETSSKKKRKPRLLEGPAGD